MGMDGQILRETNQGGKMTIDSRLQSRPTRDPFKENQYCNANEGINLVFNLISIGFEHYNPFICQGDLFRK